MSSRLKGKVIIVTGATSGIGRAIVERSVAEGARVLLHGLDEGEGTKLVRRLGPAAQLCIADLTDPDAPRRIVRKARTAFGRIDALVNNAAAIVRSNIATTREDFFDRVVAVNVRAPLFLIQAALPELKRARGCVLNIGSINAYSGEPELLDYSVSKGALMTLSRNLANSPATDPIRINHLNPGWVLTPNEDAIQRKHGQPKDWHRQIPKHFARSGRLISPEAIAAAAVFWLSDESRPINGSVVELEQFSVIGRNPPKS